MSDTTRTTRYAGTPIQKTALIIGIVFLIVGIAGFIPGVTHSAEHLHGAGAASEALLLGVFQVSVLHNVVHLLFAVAGIALAASPRASVSTSSSAGSRTSSSGCTASSRSATSS